MIRRALSQLRRTAPPRPHRLPVNHHRITSSPLPPIPSLLSSTSKPSFHPFFARSFCDDAPTNPNPPAVADASSSDPPVVDVSDEGLTPDESKELSVTDVSDKEAALLRTFSDKYEETEDDYLLEKKLWLRYDESDFEEDEGGIESDFEDMYETDEELDHLYNARQYVEKKMMTDKFNSMDEKKYDEVIKEATEAGFLKSTKECEEILEDMLNYDKLLPDVIKQNIQAKYKELEGMCDRGELEPEKAYELFKEFEDKMVAECIKIMDSKKAPEDLPEKIGDKGKKDKLAKKGKKKVELDDPPGEGPILRWESRIVFAPGGDAWHPKNRKVKLRVTVKELGLSKYASRRLREVVGKRYHSGRDELTITSERYEHREDNRKDCLRTLYSIIEDAVKADKLVEEAQNAYVKERLKKNVLFMERLKARASELKQAQAA